MPIFASWWRSNCASAASRRTSCSSRCGATPGRRSRLPPCSRPSATAMPCAGARGRSRHSQVRRIPRYLSVDAFVEKPDAATAATYVADRYLWNSGNFLFHAATMLSEIERFEPVMAEAGKAAVAGLTRDLDFMRLAAEPFARAPMKSIDYAVMERTELAAVVPADLGWSDVGSWNSV